MTSQTDYWNQVAAEAHFTHPLKAEWITSRTTGASPVLDFGCGYGRMLESLAAGGYTNLTGVDPSAAMLERARKQVPLAQFETIAPDSPATRFDDGEFGIVLLVAVLTCIPDSVDQAQILDEIDRILTPGGLLYVSDFLLQNDARNRERYARFENEGLPRGVFRIEDGRATLRHHEEGYFRGLFSRFDWLQSESFELETMKGNPAVGTRILLQKNPQVVS